jgi:Ca2+-dependent lipid-binding protein
LTPVENYIKGYYNYAKGEVSKCSANPYVTVEVGENKNFKSGIDEFITNTLNPEFNKDFNFTVNMPYDWNLVVRVFDRA